MIDDSVYAEPDGPVIRPWDPEKEYGETYPERVPPQWVTFDLPPPPWHPRRGRHETWARVVIVVAFILLEAYFFWVSIASLAVGARRIG